MSAAIAYPASEADNRRFGTAVNRFLIRQFDPAFIPAVADRVGGIVDELGDVLEHPAAPLRIVVIDEGLSPDDLDPPLPPEILARDAALSLKIDEIEHDLTPFNVFHFCKKRFMFLQKTSR